MKKRDPKEIEASIQKDRPYISMDYSTFDGMSTPARFLDEEFGEWWATPSSVERGSGHRDRWYKKEYPKKSHDVEIRIQKIKPHLTLDHSTYVNMNTKARFIDEEFGELWEKPSQVLLGRGTHRKRLLRDRAIKIEERVQKDRPYITLDYTTFQNTHTKALFTDSEYGEFWGTPANVLNGMENKERVNAKRRIPVEEVEKRIQEVSPFIKLVRATYKNTYTIASFIDEDFGEYEAIPSHVMKGVRCRERAGNKKSAPQEVERRIQKDRPFISLDYSTYQNQVEKAKFTDDTYGDWWAKPAGVIRGHCHPKRGYEKVSFSHEEILEKVENIPNITIDISTYTNISSPAKFTDSLFGSWWTTPKIVFNGSRHPKRAINSLLTAQEVEERIQLTRPWISLDASTYNNTHDKSVFIDEKYGRWEASANNVLHKGSSHPSRMNSVTDLEQATSELLGITKYDKTPSTLKGTAVRPDFKVTDKIYVDTDGLFWHCELSKDKKHHFQRREVFEKNDLRLFQFRADEIFTKPDIVKSIITNAIGKTPNVIYARNTRFTEDIDHTFFNTNHLMGYMPSKAVGLEYKGELVAGISYRVFKDVLHIERFCNSLYTNVVGGFSKLLKHITTGFSGTVVNFVDLRYGTGNHLPSLGFELKSTHLSWRWTDLQTTYNRRACRANMDERKLSQKDYAAELKWYRIYDAGQAKYVKKVDPK